MDDDQAVRNRRMRLRRRNRLFGLSLSQRPNCAQPRRTIRIIIIIIVSDNGSYVAEFASQAHREAVQSAYIGATWLLPECYIPTANEEETMVDKNRVEGAIDKAKGSVEEAAGKVTGDAKLQADGKADKAGGAVKNAVGGAADAVKGKA